MLISGSTRFYLKRKEENILLAAQPKKQLARQLGVDLSSFDRKLKNLMGSTSPQRFSVSGVKDGYSLGHGYTTVRLGLEAGFLIYWWQQVATAALSYSHCCLALQ